MLALAACSSNDDTRATTTSSAGARSEERTIDVDGHERTYLVYRPPNIGADASPALVVMLHGGFGSGEQARRSYGWDAKADAGDFVVAYPDGLDNAWNAGTCCGRSQRDRIDDVGFIDAMVDEVVVDENVDPDRVFATGISNGGMMAYRLACELTGKLAAIAPVAASMTVSCTDPAPTSVLHIHGLDDRNVPFAGGVGTKGVSKDARPSIPSVIERWRAIDGCRATPTTTTAGPVTTETSGACSEGTQVTLITIEGAGHQWPGSTPPNAAARRALDLDEPSTALSATETIWQFFSRQER